MRRTKYVIFNADAGGYKWFSTMRPTAVSQYSTNPWDGRWEDRAAALVAHQTVGDTIVLLSLNGRRITQRAPGMLHRIAQRVRRAA